MRSKSCLSAALALAALAALAPAARPDAPAIAVPDPLPLAWCQERARAASPELAAADAAAEAAGHRIRPAGSLDDPRISLQALAIPTRERDLDSTPMSGTQLGLAQKLPFPGLLGSRADAARAGARSAEERLEDTTRSVAARVEAAWAELGFAQRALDVVDANLALVRQLARVAEARYQVGRGLQQDVLRAQVRVTTLLDQRLRRVDALERAAARLAALLDLPPDTELPRTDALADASPIPALDPLVADLERTSPLLLARAAAVEQAERMQRATVLEGYPDVDVGLGYRIRSRTPGDPVKGQDFLFAGLTLRLPIDRGKWRERIAEREADVRRARALLRDARARLRDATRAAHAALVRADAQVRLLQTGLVPQARQSLVSSESGYQVGKVDFLSVLDAQVSVFDAELGAVRAQADRRTSFAALEAAVGRELR